jgi:hypothetical protein
MKQTMMFLSVLLHTPDHLSLCLVSIPHKIAPFVNSIATRKSLSEVWSNVIRHLSTS